MTIRPIINSINRSLAWRQLLLITFVLVCLGFLPRAQAVSPAPDGGYPGGNTAEGQKALFSLTSGGYNTAVGFFSLFANTIGNFNTALGAGALDLNTGDNNTATGAAALLVNTTGHNNTAVGFLALASNTIGSFNTAAGVHSLSSNIDGTSNTATGNSALAANDTGNFNTADGQAALRSNTSGGGNTALGDEALFSNTTGNDNTAVGFTTLDSNTTGDSNTAVGPQSLYSNTEGSFNTAVGPAALSSNTSGTENTTMGYAALVANTTASSNTAIGVYALVDNTGNFNTALGQRAGSAVTTADNVICIGTAGDNVSNSCYIGGISGQTVGLGGSACYVDNNGKLGVFLSARRFKTDIADMDNASEALLALRPVTFHYKPEMDKTGIPQFGLIAEEVEAANPDLVVRDKAGKVSTVRYEAVNAMLLNEFLKEHKRVQEQGTMIVRQQEQIEALTAGLQKVSAQLAAASPSLGGLELSKAAPQAVLNGE